MERRTDVVNLYSNIKLNEKDWFVSATDVEEAEVVLIHAFGTIPESCQTSDTITCNNLEEHVLFVKALELLNRSIMSGKRIILTGRMALLDALSQSQDVLRSVTRTGSTYTIEYVGTKAKVQHKCGDKYSNNRVLVSDLSMRSLVLSKSFWGPSVHRFSGHRYTSSNHSEAESYFNDGALCILSQNVECALDNLSTFVTTWCKKSEKEAIDEWFKLPKLKKVKSSSAVMSADEYYNTLHPLTSIGGTIDYEQRVYVTMPSYTYPSETLEEVINRYLNDGLSLTNPEEPI